MINIKEINKKSEDARELKKFSWLMTFVFGVIGLYLLRKSNSIFPYFLGVSALFLLLQFICKGILKQLYRGWMMLAMVMGIGVSNTILTVLYLLVFTPIAVLARRFGSKQHEDKIKFPFKDDSRKTYWITVNKKTATKDSYKKLY